MQETEQGDFQISFVDETIGQQLQGNYFGGRGEGFVREQNNRVEVGRIYFREIFVLQLPDGVAWRKCYATAWQVEEGKGRQHSFVKTELSVKSPTKKRKPEDSRQNFYRCSCGG